MKGLEDFIQLIRVESNSCVLNLHPYGFISLGFCSDDQLPAMLCDRAHRFGSVQNEIEDHLLQLHGIAKGRRNLLVQVSSQSYLQLVRLRPHQENYFSNDLIYVNFRLLTRRALKSISQPQDHVSSPLPIPDDALGCLAGLV